MDDTRKRIGYYSAKALEIAGSSWWRHADGRDVEVTNVVFAEGTEHEASCYWDDKVCLGEVLHWVRGGQPPLNGAEYLK